MTTCSFHVTTFKARSWDWLSPTNDVPCGGAAVLELCCGAAGSHRDRQHTVHSADSSTVHTCVLGGGRYSAADRRDHPTVSRVNIGESQERVYTLFIENDLGFASSELLAIYRF